MIKVGEYSGNTSHKSCFIQTACKENKDYCYSCSKKMRGYFSQYNGYALSFYRAWVGKNLSGAYSNGPGNGPYA